jgi:hypothetical protein
MILEGIFKVFSTTISLILQWWWVITPIILFLVVWELWLYYRRLQFVSKINWVLLRLVVPQEVAKTPLAMEQVFANLHSIQFAGSWYERNINGRVQEWFSIELVSIGGNIYFFLRTPVQFRNLVESAVYAQYPDAEIHEVEDYIQYVPPDIPNDEYDLFGSEFKLATDDPYPLRTYNEFQFQPFRMGPENLQGVTDVDPFAHLMEAMGHFRNNEHFWLQILIRPVDDSWKDKGKDIIEELIGRKKIEKKGPGILGFVATELGHYVRGFAEAPFRHPEFNDAAGGEDRSTEERKVPGPHEQDLVKVIANKISKVGFKTTIRGTYIAPKELYEIPRYFSVTSAFRQLTAQNRNGLRPAAITGGRWPFKKQKGRAAKKENFFKYVHRIPAHHEKSSILNTEELATLFHFPGSVVRTPALPRVETRKGEPPAELPTM